MTTPQEKAARAAYTAHPTTDTARVLDAAIAAAGGAVPMDAFPSAGLDDAVYAAFFDYIDDGGDPYAFDAYARANGIKGY